MTIAIEAITRELAPRFAERAARFDEDDAFVAENYADLKSAGFIKAAVPSDLGGLGASHAELCEMLRHFGAACGSTALALAMHTHQVATAAWRRQHQGAPLEPLLRRVADEDIVLLTSGASDWLPGSGQAQRVDAGWRINARKTFVSGAPVGDLLMTCAIADLPPSPREVLHFAVPMRAPGVRVDSNWKTLGMRGTGSHDVVIENLFVADAAVTLRRAPDVWHPMFHVVSMIAGPLIYAVYLGLAQGACQRVLALARQRRRTARLLDLTGALLNEVRCAELAHADMVAAAATNAPGMTTTNRVFTARALVARSVLRSADLALEVAGGAGFFRDAGLERLFRDMQAARFHVLQDGDQRRLASALAFGIDPDALALA